MELSDFPAFFSALNDGHTPYPWQEQLVEAVHENGSWPSVLDLPTGSGKTAVLDIATFLLALDAQHPPDERRFPRRIVMVIDRRVVVDQGYARAEEIVERLAGASQGDGVLWEARTLLEGLTAPTDGPDARPVEAGILRGGMVSTDDWARRPDQPLIVVSTVDQVGSRILFRGYGVSDSMKPVHAGLLGEDTLFFLDEVHLSVPFAETLDRLGRYRRMRSQGSGVDRWQVVRMSATPVESDEEQAPPFRLTQSDYEDETLAPRLEAGKPTTLELVQVSSREEGTKRRALADQCAEAALHLLASRDVKVLAVVVNRVDTARMVYEACRDTSSNEPRVELVTGRMRPLDQRKLYERVKPRVRAGRDRADDEPLILVATQCVEVGADFDFDALVTECASLDALRQRFGRLNRRGEFDEACAKILARSDQVSGTEDSDPVYGLALRNTWEWLDELAPDGDTIDFGTVGLADDLADLRQTDALGPLLSDKERGLVLLPSYLDALVQTNPRPDVEPDVSLWLHGQERTAPDVQVVWRADLRERELESWAREDRGADEGSSERSSGSVEEEILSRVTGCPPGSIESLSVPIWAVREWLAGVGRIQGPADVEGEREPDDVEDAGASRSVILWDGDDSRVVTGGSSKPGRDGLRPGATILVPSSYGGLDPETKNWNPGSTESVPDLGDRVQFEQRGRPTLRTHPGTLRPDVIRHTFGIESLEGTWSDPPVPPDEKAEDVDVEAEVDEWLAAISTAGTLPAWGELCLRRLRARRERNRTRHELQPQANGNEEEEGDDDDQSLSKWWTLRSKRRVPAGTIREAFSEEQATTESTTAGESDEFGAEEDSRSFIQREVPLQDHNEMVAQYAGQFAHHCGLDEGLVSDFELAGTLHDLGKTDPRCQHMLHGGDPVETALARDENTLLAKSDIPPWDRKRRRYARENSGYPRGKRHELQSLALVESTGDVVRRHTHDWDLVLHLVATHHGYCRPFAPPQLDEESEAVKVEAPFDGQVLSSSSRHGLARLDSGVADRFWRLVERYGWYGLAHLEAIFRLADHRRSSDEQAGVGREREGTP